MKKLLFLFALLPLAVSAQLLPPPRASVGEVNVGTNNYKYVTPAGLAGKTNFTGNGSGLTNLSLASSLDVIKAGADITGVSDSAAAIQSVLNAAAANGKTEVLLPSGLFSISTALRVPSYVTLRGSGNTTIVRQANGSHQEGVICNVDTTNGNTFCMIRDLIVDVNFANNGSGEGVGVLFSASQSTGVVSHCTVSGVVVSNSQLGIVSMKTGKVIGETNNHHITIIGCRVFGSSNKAIELSNTDDSTVTDNKIVGCVSGLQAIYHSRRNVFAQNIVSATTEGLLLNHGACDNLFAENWVDVTGASGVGVSFLAHTGSGANTNENNKLVNNTVRSAATLLSFTVQTGPSYFRNCELKDNTFETTHSDGGFVLGSSSAAANYYIITNWTISGNVIKAGVGKECGINLGYNAGADGSGVNGVVLANNQLFNCYVLPRVKANNVTFQGNQWRGQATHSAVRVKSNLAGITNVIFLRETVTGYARFLWGDEAGGYADIRTISGLRMLDSTADVLEINANMATGMTIENCDIDLPASGYGINIASGNHTIRNTDFRNGQHGITAATATSQLSDGNRFTSLTGTAEGGAGTYTRSDLAANNATIGGTVYANAALFTNGVALKDSANIPTNSILASSAAGTNWTYCVIGGLPRLIATNNGLAGAFLKCVGETVSDW